ncbi:MAG: hypothetical protein JST38_03320 [Bacteroidetes bacterium]|nr:hypothetical protein [Bacteroidota bacterium]
MKKLPKPTDPAGKPYDAKGVFELCVSDMSNAELKKKYVAATEDIVLAAKHYDEAAEKSELHSIPLGQLAGVLTKEELISVYTYRMVRQERPGRTVYDALLARVPNQRCPLCGVGGISSLDHHLPKAGFPTLSVVPNNLVPACGDCQDAKRSYYPKNTEQHTLHPYFDDFDSVKWLKAGINQSAPPSFEFFVDPAAPVSPVTLSRFDTHLRVFKLLKLYASNAGSELTGVQGQLHRLLVNGGAEAVRDHCLEVADSWAQVSLNSWKSAMYTAAAANDWFCQGGFLEGND